MQLINKPKLHAFLPSVMMIREQVLPHGGNRGHIDTTLLEAVCHLFIYIHHTIQLLLR